VRRNWTGLNWYCLVFDKLTNERRASRASPLVNGWRVRDYSHISPTPLDCAYCNALLLAYSSVRRKLNHVSSVQLSSVMSFYTRINTINAVRFAQINNSSLMIRKLWEERKFSTRVHYSRTMSRTKLWNCCAALRRNIDWLMPCLHDEANMKQT